MIQKRKKATNPHILQAKSPRMSGIFAWKRIKTIHPCSCCRSWLICGVLFINHSLCVYIAHFGQTVAVYTSQHFNRSESECDNYVQMQSQRAISKRSNVIHPFPRTREHKASTGKREMSLTMCGCFQLTSEACYKYSNATHCAPMLNTTQTDAITSPHSTWIYFPEAHVCTSNSSEAPLLNEHRQSVFIL